MSHMSELAAEEEQARLDADEDRYSESKDEPRIPRRNGTTIKAIWNVTEGERNHEHDG